MKKSLRMLVVATILTTGSYIFLPFGLLSNHETISAAQAAGIVQLDPAQQKELDTFFTAFSSAGLHPFRKGNLTNDEILTFAVNYNVKYNKNLKNMSDTVWGIPLQKLTDVAQNFFGMPLTIHTINNYTLDKDLYLVPKATGATNIFSKVDFVMDNGDGTYLANVGIYMGSSIGSSPISGSRFRALITKTPTGYNLKEYIMR